MKRILLILLTPALILLALWAALDFWALPAAAAWAKARIEAIGDDPSSPVAVSVGGIELRLIRPTAVIRDLEITPRGELATVLKPTRIKSVSARLNLFEAALGRLQVGALFVHGLDTELALDPLLESKSESQPLPMDQIFSWMGRLPLRALALQGSHVKLGSRKYAVNGELGVRRLVVTNLGDRLQLDVNAPEVSVERGGRALVELNLAAELTRQELRLESLLVRAGEITVRAHGRAQDPAQLTVHPRLNLSAATSFPLDKLGEQIRLFQPELKLPQLSGSLTAETEIDMKGTSDFDSAIRVNTAAVRIGAIQVGDAKIAGRLTPKALALAQIVLAHPAGKVELAQSRLEFREPYAFRSTAEVEGLDLQSLFRSLDLNKIPVEADVRGKIPCEGTLSPLHLQCAGQAFGDRLVVRAANRPSAKVIVDLRDLAIDGDVDLDAEHVVFRSKLRVGGSTGETEGRVDFKRGFRITFSTPQVSFKDVHDLAGLKFEGRAAIDGSTEGDSDAATFDLDVRAKDFVFENYTLGAVDSQMKYRRGHLLFEDLKLAQGSTRARGSMDVDLDGERIAGQASVDALEAGDLVDVFGKIWRFPLEVRGTGRAQVEFDGPLDFWKMNYKLDASVHNGRLHGDSFQSLELKAHADHGDLRIDQAVLQKQSATIAAKGGISPEKDADIAVTFTNVRLEESEFVGRIRSNVAGQANGAATIKGRLPNPEVRVQGSLADIVVDEREIPGSYFDFRFDADHVEGVTNLFGNRIQGDLHWPFRPGTSPLRVRVKTTDWPFTSLLSLIGASALQNEYESGLTADVDLQSDAGRFDQLSGTVNVNTLRIQRGAASLRNPLPMEAQLNAGKITLKNFTLEGPDQAVIRLRGEDFTPERLSVGLGVDSDLRLLHLFMPFLEDLGGRLKAEASLTGRLYKPEILGKASLANGFVRLKGFPHAIEKIQADAVFSQNRILLQSIKGQMAGGGIEGGGSILINGYGDLPVNIRLKATGLNLNVPDRVRSTGDADFVFSGRWFPYTLSGTYAVSSALFEKEFGDDGVMGGQRTSVYLPKILRQAQFDPVVLDLQILLPNNVAVRNSLMEGGVTGQLQVKGPPQNPLLAGRLTTEKGSKVIFKDKPFDVVAGTVTFNNPEEINPDIYVSAQARVSDYDINVLVQGPAKSPVIRMTSLPPLPESDIVSLLALGVTSGGNTTATSSSTSEAQAAQLGYEALGIGFQRLGPGKLIQKTTGFNVAITSTIDPTRNSTIPKITFTRKLTERLNATYARPITGDTSAQEFKLQYQLNSNVSLIGSYEERARESGSLLTDQLNNEDLFGLDLEFRREFK